MVTLDDWFGLSDAGSHVNFKSKILLTFDDALACHYNHVYSELLSRRLLGVFFAASQFYDSGNLLDVHRIHLICSKFTDLQIGKLLDDFLIRNSLNADLIDKFKFSAYGYQKNSSNVDKFKRALNYYMLPYQRKMILDAIFDRLQLDNSGHDYYASLDNLKEMNNNGMIIGCHSHSHPVMSLCSSALQEEEVQKSVNFVKNNFKNEELFFAYPYGGKDSFDNTTLKHLKNFNVSFAFTTGRRFIENSDLVNRPYELPRFDCNDFLLTN